jgi:hypothetical protein
MREGSSSDTVTPGLAISQGAQRIPHPVGESHAWREDRHPVVLAPHECWVVCLSGEKPWHSCVIC